jgi:hypothetical protein
LRAAMGAHTFRTPSPLLPDWEDNSWARGAAALVTQKLFDFEMSGGTAGGTEIVESAAASTRHTRLGNASAT